MLLDLSILIGVVGGGHRYPIVFGVRDRFTGLAGEAFEVTSFSAIKSNAQGRPHVFLDIHTHSFSDKESAS